MGVAACAACYANARRASHRAHLPAFRHKPSWQWPFGDARRARDGGGMGPVKAEDFPMKPPADNDTELSRNFEPLRVALAIGALLLGIVFGMH
jgi:hypothetical protein